MTTTTMIKRPWRQVLGFGLALTCAIAVLVAAGLAEDGGAPAATGGGAITAR